VANFDVFGNHTALRNINTAIIAKNGRIGIADSTSVRLHVTFSNFASGKFIVNTVRAVPGQEQTFYAEYDINYLSNLTPIIVSAKIGQSGGSHRINYTEWFFDSINRNLTYVVGRLAGSTIDFGLQAIGRFPDFQITKSAILPSGELLSNYQTHLNSNGNFGIGVQNATTTLDVNGTINASNYTGQTITDLSNLGIFSSNTSVSASNTTISLSNYSYLTLTPNANFASNTAVWSSNLSTPLTSLSNYVYTTSAPNSSNINNTANFASNTAVFASNNTVSLSNYSYSTLTPKVNFASNLSTPLTSLSNYVYTTSAPDVSNVINTANFASNVSVFGSNTTISLSNFVYGTNTTNITNAQTTANFASNLSIYSSNYINSTLPNGFTFNNNSPISFKDEFNVGYPVLFVNSNNNTYLKNPTSGFAMFINPDQNKPTYVNFSNATEFRIYHGLSIFFRTSSSNVGIGTNHTPVFPLDVNGTSRFRNNVLINSNNELEFGIGITKEANAGKIGYTRFSDSLDIVGAGTTNANRKVRIYEHLNVGNSITTPSIEATTALTSPSITATNSLTIGTSTIKGIFTGSATIPGSGGGSAITMTVTHNWGLLSGNFTYLLTHIDTTLPTTPEVFAFKVLSASPNTIDIYVARVDSFNAWTQTHTLQYSIVVS
jgi:hypothetical protein